jgi:hypothetical protein
MGEESVDEVQTRGRFIPLIIFVLGTVAILWVVVGLLSGSGISRVEREHNIRLPESVDDIQTLGDASSPVLRVVNLDRGASSIFTIDRVDLDELLAQFGLPSDEAPSTWFDGAPGNDIYQPGWVPWSGPEAIEGLYYTDSPPSSGDFTTVQVFGIDDQRVGVWLYTDWN